MCFSTTIDKVLARPEIRISIVIPAFNAANEIARSLESIRNSSCPVFECLVVDDGSNDNTAALAKAGGATVVAMPNRGGPAAARNHGAAHAKGDVLLFLDADVCVHADTVARVAASFQSDAALSALIGSYDDEPSDKDFLSQYRNLMHHYVHQSARESASTFWSGCGAIRRELFLQLSGFDERYARPAIEDIELGYRLHQAGCKTLLDHDLTVKHLKRWTFWNLVKTDMLDRGIPWTELILRDRHMPNDLNLQLSQRVSVALAFLLFALTAGAAIYWRGYFLTPLFALLFFVLARFWVDAASPSRPKTAPLWMTLITGAIIVMALLHHMLGLVPPLVLSQLLLLSRHRYAEATPRKRRLLRVPAIFYMLLSVLACLYYLPTHSIMFAGFFIAVVLGALNSQFYLFLASKRGILFAAAAIPLHVLYHFYSGISFLVGTIRFWSTQAGRVSRSPALSETAGRAERQ